MIHSTHSPRWKSQCLVFLLFVFMVVPVQGVYHFYGEGTVQNPYQIYSAEDLHQIRNHLSSSFILMNDIDLSEYQPWTPIGTSSTPFRGTLNGQGFTVFNLSVNRTANHSGLFGVVSGTTSFSMVEHLHIRATKIIGSDYVGGLAGTTNKVQIRNVSFEGSVEGKSHVGGLIGQAAMDSQMDSVMTSGKVAGPNSSVGGIVGRLSASALSNAKSDSEVVGTSCDATLSSLTMCSVAGMVGTMDGSSPVLSRSVFDGVLKNKTEPQEGSWVTRFAQPVVGNRVSGTIQYAYFQMNPVVFNGIGTQISHQNWYSQESFFGFDFDVKWFMEQGPNLAFMPRLKTITAMSSIGGRIELSLNETAVSSPVQAPIGSTLCVNIVEEAGYRYLSGGEKQWCITVSDHLELVAQFVLIGDVNLDGKLSTTDLVFLRRIVAGIDDVTAKQQSAMDVNGDGRISATDVVILRKKLAEME